MNPIIESAGRGPVCGGPAKDIKIAYRPGEGALELITIRACENAACDAYYPAAQQHI